MLEKSFLNMASLLVIAGGTGVASDQKSPYVDAEGYCVVDIGSGNPQPKYVQQKVIGVPDIKGHVIRVFEAEQKIKNTQLCNGDSLVSSYWYVMADCIDHDGSASGYHIYSTAKGDQLILKFTGNSQRKVDEDLADGQATGRIIGGTGALIAVEGDYQYVGKFNRDKEIIQPIMNKLRYKIVDKDAKK